MRVTLLPLLLAVVIGLTATADALSVVKDSARPQNLEGYTFGQYIREYNKRYKTAEELETRRGYFTKNLQKIIAHNAQPNALYTMGINDFVDWSPSELAALNGAKPQMRRHASKKGAAPQQFQKQAVLPFQVDYRTAFPPVLTAIKNQGGCGSCWAHSAIEAIESHWAIATGDLFVLSQQQLTSCTPNPRHCGGTGGCFGSTEALAFEYAREVGGIVEEWAYPYTSYYGDSGICNNDTSRAVVTVRGYVEVPKNDQEALMTALATVGPISVAVDANHWSFYSGGIFNQCDYAVNITQNHAVQLVGYGHDHASDRDYWIIRNSWGPRWGENGYMRMLRDGAPACGWSEDAQSGSACEGDPEEEWVCGMCGILSGATYPLV